MNVDETKSKYVCQLKRLKVTTTRYVACLFLCLLPATLLYGQSGDETVNLLTSSGFENVGWTEDARERVYVLQNTAYRLNGVGIGEAVDLIREHGMPAGAKACRIVIMDNNVPQISLYYKPIVVAGVPTTPQRRDWNVSYDIGDSWQQAHQHKENSSLFKVDVAVYPELSLKNLIITQIYQALFNLSPAVEVSFWNGMKLTAQMVFPVYNDGYGTYAGRVHPGFITLQQTYRLPYNLWLTGTAGLFNAGRYGADVKLLHALQADQRFSFEGRLGLTATYQWQGFDFHYGTKTRFTWSLGANFYWPRYNTQVSLKAEQYLLGDKAVRFDIIRHFRYASIGFYAMKGVTSKWESVRANGGFRFQVALPPYKYKRKGYIPRVLPSRNMGIAYNAGNEQYYYKGFRDNAGENIMQANSLNPFYIKSELLNF
ncbi:MAG: YjbH domain-containing protein [Prevotellaceae bacterium]|jgi:hypothetical protein|nr:YjbH domain-containing protein [Prevotellaceae bacterium]